MIQYHQQGGAGDETRTRDIFLGKEVLYQLSYARVSNDRPLSSSRRLGNQAEKRTGRRCADTTRRKLGEVLPHRLTLAPFINSGGVVETLKDPDRTP